MRASTKIFALVLAACAATVASAQTVYKLIDRNGKVTYSEEEPKHFDGQVIRIDVNPNANTAILPKPSPITESENKKRAATAKKEQDVEDLQKKLDDARTALKDAQDHPGDEDVSRVGTKNGFTRAVPTEDYQKKLAKLEDDVKKAEEALRHAGGSP
ncbi:MAG TPA: DUF4124 domain-containing protein [Usitatibacter sp.]|jgi:hypothetical protein|nr:DUF4124 domain-containing protein [Usitatibacter sp.]